MNRRTKVRIAYDMILQRKFAKFMSIFLLVVTFCISGIMIYIYGISSNYRMRVQQGFTSSIDEIYCFSTEYAETIENKEIKMYDYYINDYSEKIEETNIFAKKLNLPEHKLVWSDLVQIMAEDFDLFNINIIEGKKPNRITYCNKEMIPIYLSEKYRDKVNLGEHLYDYEEINGENILISDYEIEGFFSENSFLPSMGVCHSVLNKDGSYSLEYGIVQLYAPANTGYFKLNEGQSLENVENQLLKNSWESGAGYELLNVGATVEFNEHDTQKNLRFLEIATIILISTSILIMLVVSISNIVINGKDYGIWLTNKATKREIIEIIGGQAILKAAIALMFAIVIVFFMGKFIATELEFKSEKLAQIIAGKVLWKETIPFMLIEGVVITAVSLIVPVFRFKKTGTTMIIKGEMAETRRVSIPKLAIAVTIFVSMFVSMNLSGIFEKVIAATSTEDAFSGYRYEKNLSVNLIETNIDWDGHENRQVTKQNQVDILATLLEIPSFKGNISITNFYGTFNDGVRVFCDLIVSQNESLPYKIEKWENDSGGVFIGNALKKYLDGNKIKIFRDELPVSGIIKSNDLSKINKIVVPFESLSENSKKESVKSMFYSVSSVTVCVGSSFQQNVEKDLETLTEWLGNTGNFTVSPISENVREEIRDNHGETFFVFENIKDVITIIAFIFCILAIFETIRLYIVRKKTDIGILWSMGTKGAVLRRILIKDLSKPIVFGILTATVCEVLIYTFAFDLSITAVLKYAALAIAVVIIIEGLLMEIVLRVNMRKSIAAMVRNEE